MKSVIVIGAGVIGVSTALRLAREGVSVRLIGDEPPGEGCSSGNAGSLSAESIVPISLPGILKQVPGWLLDPEGPLYVRWRYLPIAAPWLMRWVLASRMSVVERSSLALKPLVRDAAQGYRELLGDEAFARLVREQGQLVVWTSPTKSRSEDIGHELRRKRDVAMRWVTPGEIRELEPELAPIFARGLLLERHAQLLNPLDTVRSMAAEFVGRGGVLEQARVTELRAAGESGAEVVLSSGETRRADRVVVAAGAWSDHLARQVGDFIPLETERGYHVALDGMEHLCSRPIMSGDWSLIASPIAGALRVAGTVEIAGTEAPPEYARAEVLHEHAKRMFPALRESTKSVWMGRRPSLPDSIPVLGPGRVPSIHYAVGHGHLGMTGAPRTSRMVTDMLLGRTPEIDPAPYRLDRFRKGWPF